MYRRIEGGREGESERGVNNFGDGEGRLSRNAGEIPGVGFLSHRGGVRRRIAGGFSQSGEGFSGERDGRAGGSQSSGQSKAWPTVARWCWWRCGFLCPRYL